MSQFASSEVLNVVADRRSPYCFHPRGIEPDKLQRCLEAARWAASSYNEQPWVFLVARREDDDAFSKALNCLLEANQQWAQHCGVLMLTAVQTQFSRNGKPNRVALHDLGAAAANMALQAVAEGLQVHQMAGLNLSQVRTAYSIPEGFEPQTAIALGYAKALEELGDDELSQRDRKPRERKTLSDFVFGDSWESPAPGI